MSNRIYAMDTHFMCGNEGPSIEEQAAMVKKAGYDDYYVTGAVYDLSKFDRTLKASRQAGLGLNAAFEVNLFSLAQIVLGDLRLSAPEDDIMPLGFFLLLAVLAFPLFGSGQ